MDPSTRSCRPPAPRHWLSREAGECAFPVGGTGIHLISCCRPCGRKTYCARHRALMRGPKGLSLEKLEIILRRWGA